jgi:hypothetical protein
MNYIYHHVGLPTKEIKENEEYNEKFKFHASGYFESEYGIEWLRFDKDCELHPLIQKIPHVAFVVDSIEEAIKDKEVIVEPNSPAEGVKVCFVVIDGAPIEFLQFDKPEEEVWAGSKKLQNLEFHHLGIKRDEPHKDSIQLPHLKICCTDHESNPFGLQWMYYEADAPYPELVKTETHVAFKVKNLKAVLEGKKVIIKPNSPSEGVMVAFIEENGAPIEFLEYS